MNSDWEEDRRHGFFRRPDKKGTTISSVDSSGKEKGKVKVEQNKRGIGHYIRDLFVDESYRNQGVGFQLLDEVNDYTGGGPVSLEVDSSNSSAIRLYQRQGYVITSSVTAKNGRVYYKMEK